MTIPRSEQIDLNATTFYHVMNRCVRRSFLCGLDPVSKKDFSYRKTWILSRLKSLASIFAIEICAFAIMSNHFHVVLNVDCEKANSWCENEVFMRWKSLCPKNAESCQYLPGKISQWRERLSSVSWFMKFLNEFIAKAINAEDGVSGHFWEGRFKSQALLDQQAVLSAMVYVDLNPVRAGIAKTPEESDFTSIQERINSFVSAKRTKGCLDIQPLSLKPFITCDGGRGHAIDFELKDYIELVDKTGRQLRDNKPSKKIPDSLEPILSRLSIHPEQWFALVNGVMNLFSFAVGGEVVLLNFRKRGANFPKARRFTKSIYSKKPAQSQ